MSSPEITTATIHPALVRITHWINAIAIIIMIASGLQIYNAYPIFPFLFPAFLTLGDWLGGALLWHFAAMWVLFFNFIAAVSYGVISGRYRAKLWPISAAELVADLRAALNRQLAHADLSRYNAVQKLLYAGVLVVIAIAILSGLALWKPVQFQGLVGLMGSFERARLIHFLAMVAISGFIFVHVTMALLVPASLRAMILGR